MANGIFTSPRPINEPIYSYAPGSSEKKLLKAELQRQMQSVVAISSEINGEKLSGKDPAYAVYSPQNHKHKLADCHNATAQDTQHAIEVAVKSQRRWSQLPWQERASIFLKAADLLAGKYRPILNAATMLGQGKTVYQAEIDAACELIDFLRFNVSYLEKIMHEQPYSPAGQWNRSEVRGLEGFVFAVTPFNFTAIGANLPTAPALMGCTVVWKPAPTAALAAHWTMRLLEEAGLPPGVINVVYGDPQVIGGTALSHPDLAGVHFTGSAATFNHIWKTVGSHVGTYKSYPRIVGETGGKDFVFAHPTADASALTTALVRGAFEYQGQKCSAASRAYIPKSIWAKIKKDVIATTNSIKMGDPEDFTNFMGAVIDRRAFDKIKGYIDFAKSAADAQIVAGGECDDSVGYFVRPTVIETQNPTFKTMVEEIFGPVLTVYIYDDAKLDETIELCDKSTPYSLTGAIFAQDRYAIDYLAQRLSYAAGNFYINDKPTGAVVGQQPFGGARQSGTNDKAGSMLNLLRWASMRSVKENFVPPQDISYPHMGEA